MREIIKQEQQTSFVTTEDVPINKIVFLTTLKEEELWLGGDSIDLINQQLINIPAIADYIYEQLEENGNAFVKINLNLMFTMSMTQFVQIMQNLWKSLQESNQLVAEDVIELNQLVSTIKKQWEKRFSRGTFFSSNKKSVFSYVGEADEIYFFQEMSILKLLTKPDLTESEFNYLYLLVNREIADNHCIAKSIWQPLGKISEFEQFKAIQSDLINDLTVYLQAADIDARYVFVTEHYRIKLCNKDIDALNPALVELLQKNVPDGIITVDALNRIMRENSYLIRSYHEQSTRVVTDMGRLQQEQDAKVGDMLDVTNMTLYKKYQNHKNCADIYIPNLCKLIGKMNFHVVDLNLKQQHVLKKGLDKELETIKVRLFGFKLLDFPDNQFTREKIQSTLNKLLKLEQTPEKIAPLVQVGANINVISEEYLFDTITYKRHQLAFELVKCGANVDVTDYVNNSFLAAAIRNDLANNIVLAILNKTTLINHPNSMRETPLHQAITNFRTPIISALIDKGAKVACKNSDETALRLAIRRGYGTRSMEDLFEYFPEEINFQDREGNTVVHHIIAATRKDKFDLLCKLLTQGASLTTLNKRNESAITLLANENPELLESLKEFARANNLTAFDEVVVENEDTEACRGPKF